MRRRPESAQVAALGLIQGVAELFPVSSSAHVAAVPWLLGWEVAEWAPARRKELEVALHAGALVALVPELVRSRPPLTTVVISSLPPVIAGYLFERSIEERLGGPVGLAGGLLVGAAALAGADGVPADAGGCGGGWSGFRRGGQARTTVRGFAGQRLSPGVRGFGKRHRGALGFGARHRDALGFGARHRGALGFVLGLAQAAALAPGVSRTGATLAAARALGYSRPAASRLSFGVAGPVLAGATALKAWRGRPWREWRAPAAGAAAAFAATRVSLLAFGIERRGPLWPYAVERALLAGAILAVRYRRAR